MPSIASARRCGAILVACGFSAVASAQDIDLVNATLVDTRVFFEPRLVLSDGKIVVEGYGL